MKSAFALFIAVISFCFLISPVSASVVAHWNFEDGTNGLPLSDMPLQGSVDVENGRVMKGYNSTYGPSFSDETPDAVGLSIYCNGGQDGYTTDSTMNSWSPQTWTIEISIRLDDVSGWRTFIGRDGSSNGDDSSDFYLQRSAETEAFRINYETVTGTRWVLDGDFTVESGKWYHLAITNDGYTLTMYCDKLDGNGYQVSNSLDISSQTPSENAMASSGDNWTFGRGWYNNSGNKFVDHIDGYIDNVRFSDTVLTPGQFLAYNPVSLSQTDDITILYSGDTVFTDSYDVVLTAEPSDNVIIIAAPPAGISLGNGSGQNRYLTFTGQNWEQPQTVTVSIADPQAVFDTTEIITHSTVSNDPNFNDLSVGDLTVYIQGESCGIWGFLPSDLNYDCKVDLIDFASLSSLWLATEVAADLDDFAQDWLLSTVTYDSDIYARSIQEPENSVFVNTANILNTIDEKVYGHFFEHIYHSANGGLWGELIWNRSFELNGNSTASWSIDADELIQSSTATDVHMEFGDPAWTDYIFTVQARKDSGNEGFLIVVRAADSDNFYWVNLGGWGNSLHGIESEVSGSRSLVSDQVSGSIAVGQWYDITVRCEGNNIKVWLDESDDAGEDELIIDYIDESSTFTAGAVGLGTWETQATFRNIQVTDLSGSAVLYSGLPAVQSTPFDVERWSLVGSGSALMSEDSLNDDYSVEITGDGSHTGLRQNDFKFIPQAYTGSLWMKGSVPSGVRVQLLDGETVLGSADLSAPTSSWAKYDFTVTPSASTDDGSLQIVLLGSGTVYIDQVSMMGQDSIDTGGYRPDLLAAVEELRPPVIRWPGGCFASLYLWKDGIGPQESRRRFSAYMWEDQDTNSYGTDEFLKMCEIIDTEPIICVNSGVLDSACGAPAQWKLENDSDYLQYALDWMEYCNGDQYTTTYGALRASNGHPEPYDVRYWEIDNETWDAGSSAYIAKVLQFAPAMRAKADELGFPIELAAVGSGGFSQTWNRDIIDSCAQDIDYISVHFYDSPGDYKTGPLDYEDYLINLAGYIADSNNPDMKIYNSEWNAQSTDWRTGLFAGGLLNVYERQGENFKIGGPALFLRHTSAGDWDNAFINFDHTGWFPAPNYVVMRLWHDHYCPNVVETIDTATGMNIVSTYSDDGRTLNIQVVNADSTDEAIELEIDGSFVPERAYMHFVAPGDLYARNTLEDTDAVTVEAKVLGIDGQSIRVKIPAYSASVITVERD